LGPAIQADAESVLPNSCRLSEKIMHQDAVRRSVIKLEQIAIITGGGVRMAH
jgi:hypothetical protein